MKQFMKNFIWFVVLLSSVDAFAAEKYGIIDVQKVIMNVEDGKKAKDSLQKEIKDKEKELMSEREKLEKLNQEWLKQAPLLSDEAKAAKQKEFQEKFFELRQFEMKLQNDVKRKEQEATQKIVVKVMEIVEKISKKKKLEVVFERNSAGLFYLDSYVDLTDEVIKAYGKDSNVAKAKK